ncbi:hypothetical protein FRX31_022093, partial [Thalictrum thalictroides]
EKQAEQEISTVEETRSNTKTPTVKGDDKPVSNNNNNESSTADDFAPASSNEAEKGKPVEIHLASSSNPWNLRPRGCSHRVFNEKKTNPVLTTQDSGDEKKKKPAEKRKFYISLTRQEIDEDYLQMTAGTKLSQPKKKHSKEVKQVLDSFFPGWKFNGTSADTYKIPKR